MSGGNRTSGFGPLPRLQPNWDWRAAANFMAGGLGSGLVVWAAPGGPLRTAGMALGALLVALGLLAVWAEIGRPWRAMNVLLHARRSWMTREALVAPLLLAAAAAAAAGLRGADFVAAGAALGFVYCQGRILRAARGIPAWREPRIVPLLVLTALAEGGGLWFLLQALQAAVPPAAWWVLVALVLVRRGLWAAWRAPLRSATAALACIDDAGRWLHGATMGVLAVAAIAALSPLPEGALRLLQAAAGSMVVASGLWFKFTLITRAAFTQGFTLPHWPVRGVPAHKEG